VPYRAAKPKRGSREQSAPREERRVPIEGTLEFLCVPKLFDCYRWEYSGKSGVMSIDWDARPQFSVRRLAHWYNLAPGPCREPSRFSICDPCDWGSAAEQRPGEL
jgi:hypothetical protein